MENHSFEKIIHQVVLNRELGRPNFCAIPVSPSHRPPPSHLRDSEFGRASIFPEEIGAETCVEKQNKEERERRMENRKRKRRDCADSRDAEKRAIKKRPTD